MIMSESTTSRFRSDSPKRRESNAGFSEKPRCSGSNGSSKSTIGNAGSLKSVGNGGLKSRLRHSESLPDVSSKLTIQSKLSSVREGVVKKLPRLPDDEAVPGKSKRAPICGTLCKFFLKIACIVIFATPLSLISSFVFHFFFLDSQIGIYSKQISDALLKSEAKKPFKEPPAFLSDPHPTVCSPTVAGGVRADMHGAADGGFIPSTVGAHLDSLSPSSPSPVSCSSQHHGHTHGHHDYGHAIPTPSEKLITGLTGELQRCIVMANSYNYQQVQLAHEIKNLRKKIEDMEKKFALETGGRSLTEEVELDSKLAKLNARLHRSSSAPDFETGSEQLLGDDILPLDDEKSSNNLFAGWRFLSGWWNSNP